MSIENELCTQCPFNPKNPKNNENICSALGGRAEFNKTIPDCLAYQKLTEQGIIINTLGDLLSNFPNLK